LPPGATYFVVVIALSSGVDAVGLAPLTLHLFVVFFAVMSTVTPPVALAAFAAAPIAGADPIRTGFAAAKIGLAGFLIPFVFAYHPAMLYKLQILFEWFGSDISRSAAMIRPDEITWLAFVWIMLAFTIALFLLTSALAGHERAGLTIPERILRVAAAIGMLVPSMSIALPALAIGMSLVAYHRLKQTPSGTPNAA
jgi:TRAP-type uncharacterized transport system fused permease subunit